MFKNNIDELDQHFLKDNYIINKIINVSNINSNDKVLEIGAGKGVLSELINKKTNNFTIIEKDVRLKNYLKNYKVIYNDVLKEDINNYDIIITSLPYSITEPFIYKLLDINFKRLIMICGKKFADEVIDKKINKLTLLTNLYFNTEKIIDIKPSSFEPQPRVMSSLIVIEKKEIDSLSTNELIMRYLYNYRYMKIKNALKEILIKINNITQNEARKIISSYNIDDNILNKMFDEISNIELNEITNKIMYQN